MTGPFANRREAITRALALSHEDCATCVVDVSDSKMQQLRATNRRRIEDLQYRAITKTQQCRRVGSGKDRFNFFNAEDRFGHPVLDLGQRHRDRQVVREFAGARQPGEKSLHRD